MTTIAIRPVSGTDLYHRYPNQSAPQPCIVDLDLARGTLVATYDPEIESGAPSAVLDGHVRRFFIPALRADAANALLERIAPLAERAQAGYSTRWDGRNNVAAFSADASAALDTIEALCDRAFADEGSHVVAVLAEHWFRPTGATLAEQARFVGITATSTDNDLERHAAREARGVHGVDVIDGLDEHLHMLRDAARKVA